LLEYCAKIDAVFDLSELRSQLAPHYSHTATAAVGKSVFFG
jgi:hypothetical protein